MKMELIKLFCCGVVLSVTLSTFSQDCSNPYTLCSEELMSVDSSFFGAGFNQGCFTSNNSMFFEFTTNDNTTNPSAFMPYSVDALILSSGCTDAGMDLSITAAIYQPVDPSMPCGALNEIVTCFTHTDTLNLSTGVLSPNTTYFLIIGINSTSTGFGCELDVTLSGEPLTIDACCDDNIPLGFSSSLQVSGAEIDPFGTSYVWAPSVSLDDFLSDTPIATPEFTTIYHVEANVGDCLVTDAIVVTIEEAVSPVNMFSPNGDGINDTWKISRIENFSSALITVFDRWGQEVYKSIGYTTPWDGTNDGKKLKTGTFYYTIELNSLVVESEPIVGFVVIVN